MPLPFSEAFAISDHIPVGGSLVSSNKESLT